MVLGPKCQSFSNLLRFSRVRLDCGCARVAGGQILLGESVRLGNEFQVVGHHDEDGPCGNTQHARRSGIERLREAADLGGGELVVQSVVLVEGCAGCSKGEGAGENAKDLPRRCVLVEEFE